MGLSAEIPSQDGIKHGEAAMKSTIVVLTAAGNGFRQAKVTPWDAGDTQPALRELVESGAVKPLTTGCALVPGCGRVSSVSSR